MELLKVEHLKPRVLKTEIYGQFMFVANERICVSVRSERMKERYTYFNRLMIEEEFRRREFVEVDGIIYKILDNSMRVEPL
jgi:hypothetical protein